jgi:hypothetical protein
VLGFLSPSSAISVTGACRLFCYHGVCSVLGSVLTASSASLDVLCPAYQSSLVIQGAAPPSAVPGGATSPVFRALEDACSTPSPMPLFSCVVGVQGIPDMAQCLASYDVVGAGLSLLPWSLDVPGACLSMVSSAADGPVAVSRGLGRAAGSGEGAGGGGEAQQRPARLGQASSKCRASGRSVHPTPAWEAVAGAIVGASLGHVVPSAFVSGPSGSGKSTFSRYLCNALLSSQDGRQQASARSVAYLDLDLGQPEHTPPGCLSLTLVRSPILSPPHYRAHHCLPAEALGLSSALAGAGLQSGEEGGALAAPPMWASVNAASQSLLPSTSCAEAAPAVIAMRYLGSASPRDDPSAFVAAARVLLDLYRSTLASSGVPLVVNSHGWTKGLGYEVLQSFLDVLAPTHSVVLQAERATAEVPSPSATAASSSSAFPPPLPAAPREEEWTRDPMLTPPAMAWQPAPGLASFSLSSGGGSAAIPSVFFSLPAWHAPAVGVLDAGKEAGGKCLPPRAVRSPPDLRAARVLVYLLSNLRFVDPAFVEGCVPLGAVEEGASGEAPAGSEDARDEEEGEAADGEVQGENFSGGDCAAPFRGDVVDKGGVGQSDLQIEKEQEREEEEEEEEEAGGLVNEDFGIEADALADASGNADEGTNTSNASDAQDAQAIAVCTAAPQPLHFLHPAIAHALYWRVLRRYARAVFRAVLADAPMSRTPCSGALSPAFVSHAALTLKVPVNEVCILRSPSEGVPLASNSSIGRGDGAAAQRWDIVSWSSLAITSRGSAAQDVVGVEERERARVSVGQLVALCGACPEWDRGELPQAHGVGLFSAFPPSASPPGSGSCQITTMSASLLPCLGLAYVRHFDPGEGCLHLLSPIPLAVACSARVLVPWQGPADVPPALQFRAAAEGDPFCFHPQTVLAAGSSAAASSTQRKQLKRRRLAGQN